MSDTIYACLWFAREAEEAAQFYVEVFGGRIVGVVNYPPEGPGPAGTPMTVRFELFGRSVLALNGGEAKPPSQTISLVVECGDQAIVDRVWERLGEGGSPHMCGWITDRYGVTWQVVPSRLVELVAGENLGRVMTALLKMEKLDLATIEAAAAGSA